MRPHLDHLPVKGYAICAGSSHILNVLAWVLRVRDVCACVCARVRMRVCVCTCTCMHACVRVSACALVHLCVCAVCVHVHARVCVVTSIQVTTTIMSGLMHTGAGRHRE
jgi:hypothetical protein